MKIWFINRYFDPDQSATSRMTSSLAFSLASLGWTVHVITGRQLYNDPRANLPALATAKGVIIHRVLGFRFGRAQLLGRLFDYLSFYVTASWQQWRLTARGDVVVAGTDPPLFSVCAAFISWLTGTRLINWLQDLFPEVATTLQIKGCGRWVGRGLAAVRDLSLQHAEANVVPGGVMASYLSQRGIPEERIWIRHNWSDGTKVRPIAPVENRLRQEWGLAGKFVVGYSGNMGRVHDFATILAAATALRHRTDIVFLLIGDGQHRPWIEEQVQLRGLANVVLKPFQPESALAESLSASEVHLVSLRSELEGFVVPSKFYGVAAAGRGVLFVGGPEGEVAQLVKTGCCGAAVAEGDPMSLCEWILRLQKSPQTCAAWGRNARALFETQFDQQAALAGWRDLLALAENRPVRHRLRPVWRMAWLKARAGDPDRVPIGPAKVYGHGGPNERFSTGREGHAPVTSPRFPM